MRVYTKCGDKGMTDLIGGERVSKTDARVEAYGTVDELMAFTALLADEMMGNEALSMYVSQLRDIESRLMTLSALLAVGEGGEDKVSKLKHEDTTVLEQAIDAMQAELPSITKFTIPGGDKRHSLCHVCRTITRRAERAALRVAECHEVDDSVLAYLNRLSDYFYLLGRTVTRVTASEEILWIP